MIARKGHRRRGVSSTSIIRQAGENENNPNGWYLALPKWVGHSVVGVGRSQPDVGGGGAGGDIELVEDVLAVELDGVCADAFGGGDGLVGVALGDVAEDGALGGGERSQQGGRGDLGGQGGMQNILDQTGPDAAVAEAIHRALLSAPLAILTHRPPSVNWGASRDMKKARGLCPAPPG